MQLKIGLAAAVFAAVGTFAVAEGAGEGGCGDGKCLVGTVLHFDFGRGTTLDLPIPIAGRKEDTVSSVNSVSVFQSGLRSKKGVTAMNTGVYKGFNELWPDEIADEQSFVNTGNCSGVAGESGTNGCNLAD